jgi:transposase
MQERVAADLGIGKPTQRLRQENRVLREEREILKKATQYFAGLK